MNKALLFIMAVIFSGYSFAQDSTQVWKIGGETGINASEVGFYNWSKGGDNFLSGTAFLKLFANKNINGWSWENTLDLEYGVKQEDKSFLKKTDDRIEFNSKLGKKSKMEHWFYTGQVNYKSQFSKGYEYGETLNNSTIISDFMSPGYLTISFGMDYKPNKHFSAFIAPISAKTTFVMNQDLADAGSFGVEGASYAADGHRLTEGKNIRVEMGANARFTYNKDIFENVNFFTKLDLFSNYIEHPENVDVDWETAITMKVNTFLNVVFKTHLIYDDDIDIAWEKDGEMHLSPITQFKQSLSVGLMYKF